MKKENVELLRSNITALTSALADLRNDADLLIQRIDSDHFLPLDGADALSLKLQSYRELFSNFLEDGKDLPLDAEMSFGETLQAIEEYETFINLSKERGFVLDYFRLNTTDPGNLSALDDSKAKLVQVCRTAENTIEMLEPYKQFVTLVQMENDATTNEDLARLSSFISMELVFALARKQLYIDADFDISPYLDGSCDLLAPFDSEKSVSVVQDQETVQEKEYVSDGVIIDETISEENITEDNEETGDDELTFDGPYDIEEINPSELGIDLDEEAPFLYDSVYPDVSISFQDIPAKDLNVNKFKTELKACPLMGNYLIILSAKKLVALDRLSVLPTSNAKEILESMQNAGYVAELKASSQNCVKTYYAVTSKGCAAQIRKETRAMLDSELAGLPSSIIMKPDELNESLVSGYDIIDSYVADHDYLTCLTLFSLPDNDFTIAYVMDERIARNQIIIAAFLPANKVTEEKLVDELVSVEDAFTDSDILFLVQSEADAKLIREIVLPDKSFQIEVIDGFGSSTRIQADINIPQKVEQSVGIVERIDAVDSEKEEPESTGETNEDADEITWADLGFDTIDGLIYPEKGLEIITEESKKASKPFSVKAFKKEISGLPDRDEAREILLQANEAPFFFADRVGFDNSEKTCEKLFSLGYLSRVTCPGYQPFYKLSQKGIKVFTSEGSAGFIGGRYNGDLERNEVEHMETAFVIAEILSCMPDVVRTIYPDSVFSNISGTQTLFGFAAHVVAEDGEKVLAMANMSVKPKFFKSIMEMIDEKPELLDESKAVIVIGFDKRQAELLADLYFSQYKERLSDKKLYYFDFANRNAFEYKQSGELLTADQGKEQDPEPATNTQKVVELPEEIIQSSEPEKTETVSITESAEINTEPVMIEHAGNAKAAVPAPFWQMLQKQDFYCASGLMHALAKENTSFQMICDQLGYALRDPMTNCTYSSQKIYDVFFSEKGCFSDYFLISAVIRNFFLDHQRFDHGMVGLNDAISENSVYQVSPRTKNIIHTLMEFKRSNNKGHGLDYYAKYRMSSGESYEDSIREITNEAKSLYNALVLGEVKDRAGIARFIEAKKIAFHRESLLASLLKMVADNDISELELMQEYIAESFLKDDAVIALENIDLGKLEKLVDDAWEKAQDNLTLKRANKPIVGGLKNNFINQFKKVASVLIRFVEIVEASSDDSSDEGRINYNRISKLLMTDIEKALGELSNVPEDDAAASQVLVSTLQEVLAKLDGTYRDDRQYYYLPFLQTDDVLMDENYYPFLFEVDGIPELSASNRIVHHFYEEKVSLPDRLGSIYKGEDNYGSAFLILQYLANHVTPDFPLEEWQENLAKGVKEPEADIIKKKTGFEADLELAQSYGQIDNSLGDMKEVMLQIVDQWYEITQDTQNYGFFYKIIDGYREKIKKDSIARAVELQRTLEAYTDVNPNWSEDENIKAAVVKVQERIKAQNYSAAEDMLNRLMSGDIEPDEQFIDRDYLQQFISNYSFSQRAAGSSGNTFKYLQLPENTKEGRAGNALLNNWPKSRGVSAGKISDLLKGLGFAVKSVKTGEQYENLGDNFTVKLTSPGNGRKSNYTHPISIFGSEAETGDFRVACIYGKRKAEDLISIFTAIGNAKDTLLFLDDTLTLGTRRELARRAKKDYNGRTFLVIDRVAIAFLASNYSATAINRMLMSITVPFSYYQPYIADSALVMPPEIFMGRKEELRKIESPTGVNIVYGGRQLGKSALLRMAQKDIDRDENDDRAVLVDIKELNYEQAAEKVAEELYDQYILDEPLKGEDAKSWEAIGRSLTKALRNGTEQGKINYLLLLMDEADAFIESCEAVNYRPFDILKDVQQRVGGNRFKFVVAGLRNVVRLKKNAALGNNSVLTHLSSLTVTPFKTSEARELLEVPLGYLGFRFPNDSKTEMLISNIFSTTNYFPGLLQLYCTKLIEAMRTNYAGYDEATTPPYVIREEHIKKVLADRTLDEQIKEKFTITLKVGNDDYYYLLALLAAFHYHNYKEENGINPEGMQLLAQEYGVKKIAELPVDKIEALMEELRELNVFQLIGNGNYRFTRRNFCMMMGTPREIDNEMEKYSE